MSASWMSIFNIAVASANFFLALQNLRGSKANLEHAQKNIELARENAQLHEAFLRLAANKL